MTVACFQLGVFQPIAFQAVAAGPDAFQCDAFQATAFQNECVVPPPADTGRAFYAGGIVDLLAERAPRGYEEPKAPEVIPRPVRRIIKRVAAKKAKDGRIAELDALLDALEQADIAYRAWYADLLARQVDAELERRHREEMQLREDEETLLLLF